MSDQTSFFNRPPVRIVTFGLLLALVVFVLFGTGTDGADSRRVVIGEDDLAHVISSWQSTWQRPPTHDELSTVLNRYVLEEVLYREALKQDLDLNNSMVKRSLIMQMNMLAEGQFSDQPITEADIEAYYALRQDQFMEDVRYTFTQIYFSREKRGAQTEQDAAEAIALLNNMPLDSYESGQHGDAIMLNEQFRSVSETQVKREFGDAFTEELKALPTGEWSGPVSSSFGVHAVFIAEKTATVPKPLDAVRQEIIRELEYEAKEAAKEQFYTELMQQYDIVYEGEAKRVVDGE